MTSGPPPRGVLEITAERDRIFMPSSIIRGASRRERESERLRERLPPTRHDVHHHHHHPPRRGGRDGGGEREFASIELHGIKSASAAPRGSTRGITPRSSCSLDLPSRPLDLAPLRHKRRNESASPGMLAESILRIATCRERRHLEARIISDTFQGRSFA